jgi:hypothetical protein
MIETRDSVSGVLEEAKRSQSTKVSGSGRYGGDLCGTSARGPVRIRRGFPAAINVNNGDETRCPDKGGTYTRGLPHDPFARVNSTAYQTFQTALNSGEFSDFEHIIMDDTRRRISLLLSCTR